MVEYELLVTFLPRQSILPKRHNDTPHNLESFLTSKISITYTIMRCDDRKKPFKELYLGIWIIRSGLSYLFELC